MFLEFECKSEGFFPHKKNCKKYYWCLEAAGLGMVAHTFTCPTGLFFNTLTDGCDFRRNVDCGDKEDKDTTKTTTTASPLDDFYDEDEDDSEEDPKSLKDILAAIKEAGGLDEFEDKLKKEEEEKQEKIEKEEKRRLEISTTTKNRLTKLLERKRAEAANQLNRPITGGGDEKYGREALGSTNFPQLHEGIV